MDVIPRSLQRSVPRAQHPEEEPPVGTAEPFDGPPGRSARPDGPVRDPYGGADPYGDAGRYGGEPRGAARQSGAAAGAPGAPPAARPAPVRPLTVAASLAGTALADAPLAGAPAAGARPVAAPPATAAPSAVPAGPAPDPSAAAPVDTGTPAAAAAAAAAVHGRRPPRADAGLKEHLPRVVLPGWAALLLLLACAAGAEMLLGRAGMLPWWLPGPAEAFPAGRVTAARLAVLPACVGLFTLAGLMANVGGEARVLACWGHYRGTVRRTGLVWVNPVLRRRRVDVRIRHWRSEPVEAVDRQGVPIRVGLLVVWRVRDTARAVLSVLDHEDYLREQVHAVLSRTAALLPCDTFDEPGPSLRDGQWFGEELTRALAAEALPVGLEVYSVQPLSLEYGPDVADSMRRRRVADLDAGLRNVIVDDAVEAAALAVRRLERATSQELDRQARSALMEQLLVAFVAPAGVPGASARRDGRRR
ncbi:SPFH domain-containing protein [Streptomyces sp. NPDC001380]|uniref:SPFH domain-containing protein n=1 Tax=Streptomyces sp. NPDC001380 TaxID=3364566 RepID=UPI0036B70AB1